MALRSLEPRRALPDPSPTPGPPSPGRGALAAVVLLIAGATAPHAQGDVLEVVKGGLGKVSDAVKGLYQAGSEKVSGLIGAQREKRLPQTIERLARSQEAVLVKQQHLIEYARSSPGKSTTGYVRERQNDLIAAQRENSRLYEEFRQTVPRVTAGDDGQTRRLASTIERIEGAQRGIEGNYASLSGSFGRFWETAPARTEPEAGSSQGEVAAEATVPGARSGGPDREPGSPAPSAAAAPVAPRPGPVGALTPAEGTASEVASESGEPRGRPEATASHGSPGLPSPAAGLASENPAIPVWANPRGRQAIDEWLGMAGLDPWGRYVNGTTVRAAGPADADGRSRHQYVWDVLADDPAGFATTLRAHVMDRLRGEAASVTSPAREPSGVGPPAPRGSTDGPVSAAEAQRDHRQVFSRMQQTLVSPGAGAADREAAYQRFLQSKKVRDRSIGESATGAHGPEETSGPP